MVLLQEPPWLHIGTMRSLTSPDGEEIFGLPTLRGFHSFFPDPSTWSSTEARGPRVCVLVHKRWSSLSIQYRQDLSPTRDICTIVMNVKWADGESLPLYISSAYNGSYHEVDTLDKRLDELPIPVTAHWILAGDFNRHDDL